MRRETVNITRAVDLLEANLMDVARVTEWANLMGYKNPKKFSRRFLRHYTVRRKSDNELLARVNSLGAWVDLETGRPIRIPQQFLEDFRPNITQG